jgi:DNA polymerase III subunit delta
MAGIGLLMVMRFEKKPLGLLFVATRGFGNCNLWIISTILMSDYKKVIQQIRNKAFYPIYFLMGDEPFFIDQISKAIEEEVLDESFRDFNQVVVYGHDVDVAQVHGMAKRYPMMASHMVLIVREAQHIRNIDDLLPYVENPLKSTILVLNYKYKKIDKRTKFYKALQKHGLTFESDKLKDYHLPNWINGYVREQGYQINEKNCLLLSENLGNNLGKIVNELEKVFIALPAGSQITTEIIERNIGISKDYNIFELQNALGAKDIEKATRIMLYFGNNPKEAPMPVLMAVLYGFFSKLLRLHFMNTRDKQVISERLGINLYFVPQFMQAAQNYPIQKVIKIIEHLRTYDMKSKGVDNASVSHSELLKELLFKILH